MEWGGGEGQRASEGVGLVMEGFVRDSELAL